MLSGVLRFVGTTTINILADAGEIWHLATSAGSRVFRRPFRRHIRLSATLMQAVEAGNRSLFLVSLISFLVGVIIALQSAYQLQQMGAVDLVTSLVGISITRELGPLLTAIIVAGRFGSAIAAELGTMQVSQEVDALTVMGIDPVSYLVVPRLAGLMLVLPCLTVFADAIGIAGGLFVGVAVLDMGAQGYIIRTFDALVLEDIVTGLVKAMAFAIIIGLVGCHQGLSTRGGAEAVGKSTTRAVVRSIVLVITADLFVTALFFARG